MLSRAFCQSECKLYDIKNLCVQWSSKQYASRNQLQKLLRHLLYIHKCIPPARLFTNRILNTLRNAPKVGKIKLDTEFF